jgi:hypothetical protein
MTTLGINEMNCCDYKAQLKHALRNSSETIICIIGEVKLRNESKEF